jgi:hypothetical protein
MALGLLTATAGTVNGFLFVFFFSFFTSILSFQTILTSDFTLLFGGGC